MLLKRLIYKYMQVVGLVSIIYCKVFVIGYRCVYMFINVSVVV